MKEKIIIAVFVMILMPATFVLLGAESVVFNGCFENDGWIDEITDETIPQRWYDVNIPSETFSGWVKTGWSTCVENGYSLTICSRGYEAPGTPVISVGDMATVSQEVYLADVNEVIFDLKLTEVYTGNWDPVKRTAVVLIDGEVVWDSGVLGPGANGEYQVWFDVNDIYKDANSHVLSLGIRSEVTEVGPLYQYRTMWDFVRFDTHCEGFGYLPADIDRDCFVDMNDLKLLTEQWLEDEPESRRDLYEDGFIDFFDFTVLLEDWMGDSFSYTQQYGLLEYDLNNDGIVNFIDYTMLTADYSGEDYAEIGELAESWLEVSWLYWLD